jgi:hypothetical protein
MFIYLKKLAYFLVGKFMCWCGELSKNYHDFILKGMIKVYIHFLACISLYKLLWIENQGFMHQPRQGRKFDLRSYPNTYFSLNTDRYLMRFLFPCLFNSKIYRSLIWSIVEIPWQKQWKVSPTKFYYNCFQAQGHIKYIF